ncbi:MAG: VOC family protein [Solirubrobacteraceae bacterium]
MIGAWQRPSKPCPPGVQHPHRKARGRGPDFRAGDEILWEIGEHATLFIERDPARAGTGRITLSVVGLDALLESVAARRIDHEPIESYSNGVRHVKIPDPDGNAIAFAEPPDAA